MLYFKFVIISDNHVPKVKKKKERLTSVFSAIPLVLVLAIKPLSQRGFIAFSISNLASHLFLPLFEEFIKEAFNKTARCCAKHVKNTLQRAQLQGIDAHLRQAVYV